MRVRQYAPSNNKKTEEETAQQLINWHFHNFMNIQLGSDWTSQELVERVSKKEEGHDYSDTTITYYLDGVPKLKLEPAYEPHGNKLSFTIKATHL